MKSGVLYRITADITAANNTGWDAVSKTQVTVGGELQNVYSLITIATVEETEQYLGI